MAYAYPVMETYGHSRPVMVGRASTKEEAARIAAERRAQCPERKYWDFAYQAPRVTDRAVYHPYMGRDSRPDIAKFYAVSIADVVKAETGEGFAIEGWWM